MNNIETDSRQKFSEGKTYKAAEISVSLFHSDGDFSARLRAEKARMLLPLITDKRVLDIGCGNGQHLADLSPYIGCGIGVDFSVPFIKHAVKTFGHDSKLQYMVADARRLPLPASSVDCAYSFATMYIIDDVEPIYAELARVLVPGGFAVLELGNALSFATLVARQYDHIAQHSRRRVGEHLESLRRHGFRVVTWRAFQLLPMWGDQPRWLQVLRRPALERLVMRRIKGRMIDGWISSLPGLRRLAFRHVIVCERAV